MIQAYVDHVYQCVYVVLPRGAMSAGPPRSPPPTSFFCMILPLVFSHL